MSTCVDVIDEQVPSESAVEEDEISLTESQNGQNGERVGNAFFVSRPIYNKSNFYNSYDHDPNRDKAFREKLGKLRPNVSCKIVAKVLLSFIPVISWLSKYQLRKNLPMDIAAGLTVGVMNIPQGLAYALLASLSPIVGLYTSFVPVLIYFFLGTSKHLAVGTFAIISTMVGEVCDRELGVSSGKIAEDESRKLEIATSLTLLVGIIQAVMGLAHLGFVTVYLSRPLVSGFTTGAAFIVFTSQVKYFFGLDPPRYPGVLALPKTYIYIFKNISRTNFAALTTGVICILILISVDYLNRRYQSRLPFPIPSQLIVIIIGASVSHAANLNDKFDLSIIGSIPKGFPPVAVPKLDRFGNLITDAFLIAIVAATTNLSLVKLFAQKHEYKTDSNQELLAYGIVNVSGSFFSSFVSSGSLSRSVVQEGMGKTQIASFVSSFVILLVLLFIAPLFEPLPKPVLAAIVVVSLRRLFLQFQQLKSIGIISLVDGIVWFATCFSVVLLGIVFGLIVGLGITLLSIIYRSSQAKLRTLGHVRNTDLYQDREQCLCTKSYKGIVILQFQGALIFVNAEKLVDDVIEIIREKNSSPKLGDKVTVSVSTDSEVLSNYMVEAVVSEGEKQVKVKMIRSLNPMATINEGSDDFIAATTSEENQPSNISELNISPEKKDSKKIHSVILDLSPVTMIDYVGLLCLRQVVEKSKDLNVEVYLAGCSYYLQRHFAREEFMKSYVEEKSFVSVHDAVLNCRRKNLRIKGLNHDSSVSRPQEVESPVTTNVRLDDE